MATRWGVSALLCDGAVGLAVAQLSAAGTSWS